jgi:hypothetical protein
MDIKISQAKFEVFESFQEYVSQGGSIITFPEYYLFKNETKDIKLARDLVLLALCEEMVLARKHAHMFDVLNTIFTFERWKLNDFKTFLDHISDSEILAPYRQAIFALHENCKNYFKSC